MANDLIHLAMEEACRKFGGNDGVFNAAGFSQAMMHHARLRGGIDGLLVRVLLTGRDDVDVLHGGSHYRLRTP